MNSKLFRRASAAVAWLAVILLAGISCDKKPVDPPPPTPVTVSLADGSPTFSPNAELIAFFNAGPTPSNIGIWLKDTLTGSETKILDWATSGTVTSLDWGDAGILAANGAEVYTLDTAGNKRPFPPAGGSTQAAWSDDCATITFARDFTLWLMDSSGSNIRPIEPSDTSAVLFGEKRTPDWMGADIVHERFDSARTYSFIASIDTGSQAATEIDSSTAIDKLTWPLSLGGGAVGWVALRRDNLQHSQIWHNMGGMNTCLTCGDERNFGGHIFDYHPATGRFVYTNPADGSLYLTGNGGTNPVKWTDPQSR